MNTQILDARITGLPLSVHDVLRQIDEAAGKRVQTKSLPPIEQPLQTLPDGEYDLDIMKRRNDMERRAYCDVLTDVCDNYNSIPISKASIFNIHKRLFAYHDTTNDHRGVYRQAETKVETKDRHGKVVRILVEGTPVAEMPAAMDTLFAWFEETDTAGAYHPLLRICVFLVTFLKIHPFHDGNGRVSRVLTDLLLLRAGYHAELWYPLEKIIEDDTEAYYLALSHSQKTLGTEHESVETWVIYMLGAIYQQTMRAKSIQAAHDVEPAVEPALA